MLGMVVRSGVTAGLLLASVGLASAQVVYAHPHRAPDFDILSPYDESYGTSPSYEIQTRPYPYGPVARVVERCQYPDGWNVTDFSRDINGTPNGLDHTCPAPARRGRRARN